MTLNQSVEVCRNCGRPFSGHPSVKWGHAYEPAYIVKSYVVHDYYGCDTGCCGHSVIGEDDHGHEIYRQFEFTHPYADTHEQRFAWARELALEHLPNVPFDFEESQVSDD